MKPSAHNLFARVPGKEVWLIANPLYGTADLLSREEAAAYKARTFEDDGPWARRGYLVDPDEEAERFNAAYLAFLKEREQEELQLFYAPTYACELDCRYCYQDGYRAAEAAPPEVLASFFRYVDQTFGNRRKYLTLFGGEPLLKGDASRRTVARFLASAAKRGLETAVVTNGYRVSDYLDILRGARIREIQVTLDGLRAVHDARRPLKDGGGTFDRIVAGVDQLLAHDIPVNLRVVVDRENIDQLPKLAELAADRGWTAHAGFKTQIGRNYELHHCSRSPEALFDRLSLAAHLAALIEELPTFKAFHAPAFHFARHLGETGAMPAPVFDACPGAKTEWAFDYTGRIYSCTATVGKLDEALGTFHPEVRLDDDRVFEWQDRDVLAIDACRDCGARLVCGGGCGAVAKNRQGSLLAPDCRPVAEIGALGAPVYLPLDEGDDSKKNPPPPPTRGCSIK